jgi:signal transduction histidine kinase
MRLRTRLFVFVGGVVAMTVALVTWFVSVSARRELERLEASRTAALMSQFRREFAHEGEDVATRVDRVVASGEFRRTAAELTGGAADRAAYVSAAIPLAAAQDLDFLDILADDGAIVSSAHWPARFGYRQPWAPGAASAAGHDAFLQPIGSAEGTVLGLLAARTVSDSSGRVIVIGGRRLDREFLQSLDLPVGMRALLYRNVNPEKSGQLIDASGPVPDARHVAALIARVRERGQEASDTIQWPDGREVVHGIPLRGRDGGIVAVLLVGNSGRQVDALIRRIILSGVGLAVLGIVVGGVLSYAVASKVTRPVEDLADAARRLADGDWDTPVHVRASGEVGALATAFGEMTRQLVEQRERLVQAERVAAWREVARRLAHELKNPLFPLRITIDNLQRAKAAHPQEFDEVFEESMGTLTTGLANLNAVIGRFSDFAKVPAPVVELASPNEIVRATLRLFQAQLEAPGRPTIAVKENLDGGIEPIPIDAEQLGRALQNLVLNAIDAMPAGGTLTIRTRRVANTVRIEVSDTGEGLIPEERDRVFTPYYTTKQHGTGLGLAIVQSVVSDHGGRIRVESQRGRGTTFHIELPAEGRGESTA